MSKYAQYQTNLRDEVYLLSALRALGCVVERHEQPQLLNGFEGTSEGKLATIILRRTANSGVKVCGLGDLGFIRDASGNFTAIADDYHPDDLKSWMGQVKQHYTEARMMAVQRSRGYIFQGRKTQDDGRIKLLFAVRG